VDSGADRTVLPLSVAIRLEVPDTLERGSERGLGAEGHAFPVWSATVPMYGRVVADDGTPWGPRFPLHPMFADTGIPLLGREDFFRAFTVTFQEHPDTPVYHLDAA
jgi:hypothetical protein